MTIKSDKWIKKMCNPPIGMVLFRSRDGRGSLHFRRWYYAHTKEVFSNGESTILIESKTFEEGIYNLKKRIIGIPEWKPMITPFVDRGVSEENGKKVLSYGLTSYGYDARIAPEFKIFTNINTTMIDPLNFDEKSYHYQESDKCVIPPNSFVLARTVERFCIPRNVLATVQSKSTYARCGIPTLATPLEPEWEGYVTLEFANVTPCPAVIYANQGGVQVNFYESDEPCDVSYADKKGKYQSQGAFIVPPKG